ncbi:hypothetical protein EV121DRAFT_203223 [Schizophyllum commune]
MSATCSKCGSDVATPTARVDATTQTECPASTAQALSWQTQRCPSVGHHVLGWVITDEMCHAFCRRGCPTSLHDGGAPFDEAKHLSRLRLFVCGILAYNYGLPCASYKLVYLDSEHFRRHPSQHDRTLGAALVLTDNWGYSELQRSLPEPALVDALQRELETEEEPRWLMYAD